MGTPLILVVFGRTITREFTRGKMGCSDAYILMGIEDLIGPNKFYYHIVWDSNESTTSGIKWVPQEVGHNTAGGGAAIAHLDDDPRLDLVLMAIDNPSEANTFWYVVGWNLDENGETSDWSSVKIGPEVGHHTAGGGAAIANLDDDPRHDLVFMAVDNPSEANTFWYVVGWNLDENGETSNWSSVKIGPEVGHHTAGGGAAIDNLDDNPRLDLVLMAIDNPSEANEFWYVVGWNLDENGETSDWSSVKIGPEVGHKTNGGGAAFGHIGHNYSTPDLLFMAIDNP